MFLFSCAYAYAYVACVMLIAQVWTRLKKNEHVCFSCAYAYGYAYAYADAQVRTVSDK